jgi:hypothetical protein
MKYIVYISTSVELMTDEELTEILNEARENNSAKDVTGVLLYSEGTFIQVLEGEPEAIEQIFARIYLDRRHKNIIKLIDKPLEERNFAEWAMGFTTPDAEKVRELEGYLKSTSDILNNDKNHSALTILKTFITTNNLVINY